jgi:hypothetical protein
LIAGLLDSQGRSSGWGNFDHVSELLGVPIDARLTVVLIAVAIAGLLRGFVGFGAALITVPVRGNAAALRPHDARARLRVVGAKLTPRVPAHELDLFSANASLRG